MLEYVKNKVTLTLSEEEVNEFWHLIMFALDYSEIAKKHPRDYSQMSDTQIKLAHKIEEVVRPEFG